MVEVVFNDLAALAAHRFVSLRREFVLAAAMEGLTNRLPSISSTGALSAHFSAVSVKLRAVIKNPPSALAAITASCRRAIAGMPIGVMSAGGAHSVMNFLPAFVVTRNGALGSVTIA